MAHNLLRVEELIEPASGFGKNIQYLLQVRLQVEGFSNDGLG